MTQKSEFQIVANAYLKRRLRSGFIRIDEEREIDNSFVWSAEYQLFLDEILDNTKDYKPNHWSQTHFPNGQARKPISGISYVSALQFCKWLETRSPNYIYRLPTQEEIQNLSEDLDDEHMYAAWLLEGRVGEKHDNFIKKYMKYYTFDKLEYFGSISHPTVAFYTLSTILKQLVSELEFSNLMQKYLNPRVILGNYRQRVIKRDILSDLVAVNSFKGKLPRKSEIIYDIIDLQKVLLVALNRTQNNYSDKLGRKTYNKINTYLNLLKNKLFDDFSNIKNVPYAIKSIRNLVSNVSKDSIHLLILITQLFELHYEVIETFKKRKR